MTASVDNSAGSDDDLWLYALLFLAQEEKKDEMSHSRKGTDVRARTALPHVRLQPQGQATPTQQQQQKENEIGTDEFLDLHEETLNKVVDASVGTLVQGIADLVNLQKIEGRDEYHLQAQKFQSQVRTEAMIKAAHDLLALTHSLKLMHVLSDTDTSAKIRSKRGAELRAEIASLKEQTK